MQKSLAHDAFDMSKAIAAIEPADTAVGTRISAAQRAESSGSRAASMLNQLAARARTERAGQGPIDPLAALVLANEKGPGGGEDGDYILTAGQLDRAEQFMSVMNGADQLAFQKLLSGAKSPEEARPTSTSTWTPTTTGGRPSPGSRRPWTRASRCRSAPSTRPVPRRVRTATTTRW
ncbi:hypothetical protein ACFWP2_38735 [Kitasatospora sp. NPDC058444]|uniref:hypothetical protein n=1 Tax=Kitasatospora sp. NPDC058444 TaxID=3346504 RepID=UPI00364E6460